jgi:prepilin-type N-terminal cleavage/methylation domain-containing protein
MSDPTRNRARRGWRRLRRGLSLVEVMVSLAIAALLLTAAAAAFEASGRAVQTNDEFFRATQAARVTLNQILTQARRGAVDEVWTTTTLNVITEEADGTSRDVTYQYLPDLKKLVLVTNDVPDDADYTLASNVADMRFDVEVGEDYNKAPCVAHVAVSIAVEVGKNQVRLSGSAAPRRNLVY